MPPPHGDVEAHERVWGPRRKGWTGFLGPVKADSQGRDMDVFGVSDMWARKCRKLRCMAWAGRLVDVGEPRREGLGKIISREKVYVMCRAGGIAYCLFSSCLWDQVTCLPFVWYCVAFVLQLLHLRYFIYTTANNTFFNGRLIRRTSRRRHRRPHAQHLLPPTPARSPAHSVDQPCQRDQRCNCRRLRPLACRSRHRNPPRLVRVEAELRDIATHQSTCG
jgi:hypothetical protein